MEVLSNIPNAILNNIGFMAILFMVYECVKWMGNLKPAKLFLFAGAIQVISLLQFISSIFAAHTFSLIEMTAKIANVTIPLNNNNNIQWLTLIGFTYCIILIYFLVRILFQFKYIAGLKKSANFTQSDFLTSSLPTHILKNTANIKIGFSDQIDAPITFGWLTPIVLLPIAICNQLTTKEMETILIHEIAHILRKDYLVNIIISLNQTILFFNPFSILLNKEMSLQREIACDLIVIINNPKKVEYMNALLKIAEHVNNRISNSASLTMGILGSQSELLKRIQYFNNVSIHSSKQLIIKLSMGAVLGSFIFISTGPTTITNNNTPIAINANYIKKNKKLDMEKSYARLIENNKTWVAEQLQLDPNFFENLSKGQAPEYLWIGCSDSRVPAESITGTDPGEMFVHRNIANMVVHSDMNMLSVLSYAVEVLKVKHVIVCGHYGCGGVMAAMKNQQFGLIDNWLRHIKDVYRYHHQELDAIEDETLRARRFVEVNVQEQVHDLGKTSIVQNAWKRNQPLHLHGWVYDIHDGLINDLGVNFTCPKDLHSVYHLD